MFLKSWNVPGPFNLPFIGALYKVVAKPENIYDRLTQIQENYPGGGKLWLGPKLIYFLHKPEHIEKVLGSYKLVQKDDEYRAATHVIGEGLILAPSET
ncbi:hypothetical protein GWI33_022697 [Rhynchophorus ferrugineus]|uniref:Cytochrome P450 n=1 Tax=Rhynchophorus ferrugineus TaxID=354439 RepID=A0A834IUC6_RHYFE|nr:hypothetical protein GWI33_022697 [Rhynchophorus ferrugineus]